MIYDPRRAGGILAALTAIVAAMALYGLILHASLRPAAEWLHARDQTFMVAMNFKGPSSRVLSILRDQKLSAAAPPRRLGVLVGPSVLQEGIDPALLTSELGGDRRWANLLVGALAYSSNEFVKLSYQAGLHPDVLIFVCNPGIVVANQDTQADRVWYDPRLLYDHLASRQFTLARADFNELTLVPWHLAFPHRGHVFTAFDQLLNDTKIRIHRALGRSGLDIFGSPNVDPWVEPHPHPEATGKPDEIGEQVLLGFIGRKGWFDPARYREDTRNFELLCDLFRFAHSQGTRCFLVLVPESSRLREKTPPGATAPILRGLPRALGPDAPVILDYREALPDDEFGNVNHLNPRGREILTRRLARDLRPYLEGRSDPAPR